MKARIDKKVMGAVMGVTCLLMAGGSQAKDAVTKNVGAHLATTNSSSDTMYLSYDTGSSDCSIIAPQFALGGQSVGVMVLGFLRLQDCDQVGPLSVSFDAGEFYDGNFRYLSSGDARIPYKIISADTGEEWGDGGAAGTYPNATAKVIAPASDDDAMQVLIQLADDPARYPPGTYADTVRVTVDY